MKKLNNIFYRVVAVAAMLVACNSAWAEWYLWYNNDTENQNNPGESCYKVSGAGSLSNNIWTWENISVRTNGNEHNYFYFTSSSNSYAPINPGNLDNSHITYTAGGAISRVEKIDWSGNRGLRIDATSSCTVTITIKENGDNDATVTISGGGGGTTYTLCGSKLSDGDAGSIFGTAWCTTCTANILTSDDGYYTKSYTKVQDDIKFQLHDGTNYITMDYDDDPPTALNDVTRQGTAGGNLTLSSEQGSNSKRTAFDFTIKYNSSTGKTYLITTPYIFFKGPIFNKGNWTDDYGANCWAWTSIEEVNGKWEFTYDWTINATGLTDKRFTVCTLTNENDGYKLPNYDTPELVGVERESGTYWNYKATTAVAGQMENGDEMRLKVTRRGAEDYKVELINLSKEDPDPTPVESNVPIIRMGSNPTVSSSNCGLSADAYVSQIGCDNSLSKMTLYYSNNKAFRIDGSNKTKVKEVTESLPTAINTDKTFTLTSAEVNDVVNPGETLYLRATGTNGTGTGPYSDIVPLQYVCNKFITQNLAVNFRACPGEHQFTWSDMFKSPTPSTWDVKKGAADGPDAKSDFTLKDGEMIWNTTGKTETSYTYYFTGHSDLCDDATATLTITYTVPGSITGAISEVTASPTSTTPFTEVSLSATGTQGNITIIDWVATPAGAEIYSKSGNTLTATAKFKAEAKSVSTTYTVTVTGYAGEKNAGDCASTASKTATITVAPDVTEVCP